MLKLTKKGLQRVLRGHPWIFRTDLNLPEGAPTPQPGALVSYAGPDGRVMGIAAWSPKSSIALRALPIDPKGPNGARSTEDLEQAYKELILSALDRRKERPLACRLCNADADGLPGLTIDRYNDGISIQALTWSAYNRLETIVQILVDRYNPSVIALRNDSKVSEHEGLPYEKRLLRGTNSVVKAPIGDLTLTFDLIEGQKTGGFLDQTDNRIAAAQFARGSCLDCFCYDGGFSLQLAKKGLNVTAVDSSAPALAKLQENAQVNHLIITTVEENVFDLLRDYESKGQSFDTIILDPPAFIRTRAAREAGRRAYKEINLRAFKLLAKHGRLVTCSCSAHMERPEFETVVAEAAADAHRFARVIERRSAAPDHPSMLTAPETDYLKVLFIEVE